MKDIYRSGCVSILPSSPFSIFFNIPLHQLVVMWGVAPYGVIGGYQHFEGTHSLHLQELK
jgi:hypothetical protein